MSYNDFWFIDTRVQTRNLRRWLIWFILLFAFVTVGSIVAVKSMYKDIPGETINNGNPSITISEAKATNVNGYIKGEIKNEGEAETNKGFLCFLLCDKNNAVKGVEYIEVNSLAAGESKTYELKFKRDYITNFYVMMVEEKIEN